MELPENQAASGVVCRRSRAEGSLPDSYLSALSSLGLFTTLFFLRLQSESPLLFVRLY
ncbi:hypothetical protein SALBM311S_07654 [Streptomyces alboniger]